jgi:hypothetical protein
MLWEPEIYSLFIFITIIILMYHIYISHTNLHWYN